jgi:hypothetical protein
MAGTLWKWKAAVNEDSLAGQTDFRVTRTGDFTAKLQNHPFRG